MFCCHRNYRLLVCPCIGVVASDAYSVLCTFYRVSNLQIFVTLLSQAAVGQPPLRDTRVTKVYVSKLTRNVTEEHVREIFGVYGSIKQAALVVDEKVGLPKGGANLEYEQHDQAARAVEYMDGA